MRTVIEIMTRKWTEFLLVWLIGAGVLVALPYLTPLVTVSIGGALLASPILGAIFVLGKPFLPNLIKPSESVEAIVACSFFSILAISIQFLSLSSFFPGFDVHTRGYFSFVCALIYVFITWPLSSLFLMFLDQFFEW